MSDTNHYWSQSLPPLWQPHSQGPLLLVPWSERERERQTLENAGHVSPRIWEMTKRNIEGGTGKFSPLLLTCQPLPLCYVLLSPRLWETRDLAFSRVSLSLSLQGTEKERTLGTRLPLWLVVFPDMSCLVHWLSYCCWEVSAAEVDCKKHML